MHRLIPWCLAIALISTAAVAASVNFGGPALVSALVDETGSPIQASNPLDVAATITPSGTQDVNVTQTGGASVALGHGTAATALRVELPTDGTGTLATVGTVSTITNPVTVSTHAVTQSGPWTVQPGNTANTTAWLITNLTAGTAYSGAVTSTAVAANASPTKLRAYAIYNGTAAVCYLQFWNLASGSVTVGTTAPLFSIGIPANGGANFNLAYNFSTALTVAATTTRAGSSSCTMDVNLFQD